MRVFVTGASGWIGSAVVPELIGSGHQVVGLARSDASAEALAAAGADVLRGTLDDLDTLQAAAADSDGVIHLAFKHESAFSGDFVGAADADRRAVEAFGETLAGSGRPLVIASGVVGLAPGRPATERDGRGPDPAAAALGGGPLTRLGTAQLTLALAAARHPVLGGATRADVSRRGGQRLHGDAGRHRPRQGRLGLRRRRVQPLARHAPPRCRPPLPLALEKAPAGSALHAVAEEGVPIRQVAEVIGRHLDLPVVAISPEDAAEHFGFLGVFIGADVPASSASTRDTAGMAADAAGTHRRHGRGPLLPPAVGSLKLRPRRARRLVEWPRSALRPAARISRRRARPTRSPPVTSGTPAVGRDPQ